MLNAFLAVADCGSFSLAAEKLFLTQPAVSKRIASLEGELGTPLFDRVGKRVILTEAGRVLLPRARHIVQELVDSRRLIANLSQEVGGTLQFATSHHIGLHRLPGVLRDFTQQYPQVELDIRFTSSESACAMVAGGDIEMAVVTLPDDEFQNLTIEKLWDDPMSLMVTRDHALAMNSIDAQRLSDYPAIFLKSETFTRRLIEKPLIALGVDIKTGLEINYLETIRMLVSVGLGWSVLPLSMRTKELRIVEVKQIHFQRELGVVTHYARTRSKAAYAFLELLRAAA